MADETIRTVSEDEPDALNDARLAIGSQMMQIHSSGIQRAKNDLKHEM